MDATRRDFLGAMACAFAAAKLPCRIPQIAEGEKAETGYTTLQNGMVICWGVDKSTKPSILGFQVMRRVFEDGRWVSLILPVPSHYGALHTADLEIGINL